jgi:hypothetical protein
MMQAGPMAGLTAAAWMYKNILGCLRGGAFRRFNTYVKDSI